VTALRHPLPAVRETAATALGDVGASEAIPALGDALSDSEWLVRRAAVRALVSLLTRFGGQPLPKTGHQQRSTANGAGVYGSQGKDQDLDGALVSRQASVLVQALQDETWQVREAAAEALAIIGPQLDGQSERDRLTEALIQSLGDQRSPVRKAAAAALANQRPAELEVLSEALHHSDWQRQEGAAAALSLLGQDCKDRELQARIVLLLTGAVSDPDPRLRLSAVKALGQIGQNMEDPKHKQSIVQSLTIALTDQDGQVRESAARALGRIGDAKAAKALIDLLQDPKESVQNTAAQALDRLARAQGIQTGPLRS
jgi:HEAT repeat protein